LSFFIRTETREDQDSQRLRRSENGRPLKIYPPPPPDGASLASNLVLVDVPLKNLKKTHGNYDITKR